ncbi:MAG: YncE family protein [Sphingobium sp.]
MKTLRLALAALLASAAVSAGAATIVLGGYPDQIQFIDDTDGTVEERITLDSGLPTNIQMSQDRKRIYITTYTTSGIEVMDAATRKIISRVSLNTPMTHYRFIGGVPDPTGRYFYILGDRFDKEIDSYRVGKPRFMVVDLKSGKVVRSAELEPQDIAGMAYRARLAVSPDGKTLYAFQKKILVVDIGDLKVVDRIDLEKPDFPDMMGVGIGGVLETIRKPGEYVSLFNAEDPYIHNKVFGIARFNLSSRTFTFDPIGPAPEQMAGLEVTPDGKEGYTVVVNGDLGSQRCEFWRFDLTTNAAVDKAEFPCRRRFYFGMSRDAQKLYIYGAGYDIAVYDAKTLKFEQDWELKNDITMAGMLTLP